MLCRFKGRFEEAGAAARRPANAGSACLPPSQLHSPPGLCRCAAACPAFQTPRISCGTARSPLRSRGGCTPSDRVKAGAGQGRQVGKHLARQSCGQAGSQALEQYTNSTRASEPQQHPGQQQGSEDRGLYVLLCGAAAECAHLAAQRRHAVVLQPAHALQIQHMHV